MHLQTHRAKTRELHHVVVKVFRYPAWDSNTYEILSVCFQKLFNFNETPAGIITNMQRQLCSDRWHLQQFNVVPREKTDKRSVKSWKGSDQECARNEAGNFAGKERRIREGHANQKNDGQGKGAGKNGRNR